MRATDERTTREHGIDSLTLMENAGAAVARFVLRKFPRARRILALCGRGNNGGDGLVAARHLTEAGCVVEVLVAGLLDQWMGDAATMLARLPGLAYEYAPQTAASRIARADLVLDALVGTGFHPPLTGAAAELRDLVNAATVPVVAVDLPSGWDADSREYAAEGAIRADAVVTFTAPKPAHVCGNLTGSATRPIVVAEIGSPAEAIRSNLNLRWTGSAAHLVHKPRPAEDNKGRHGHVLLVAGSHGKSGAPSMAALAALRAGAGLVTAAVPRSILNTVARIAPELMTEPLAEEDGDLAAANFTTGAISSLLEKKTVLAVGPGLGQSPGAEHAVLTLVKETHLPLVLDADALNILAKHKSLLSVLSSHGSRTVVLTPHPGEMARLAGLSIPEVQANREGLARQFATTHRLTLVLKGWRTLVAHADGSIAVNTTGNPGLAKGGSGDILTGIVAALLAQLPDERAAAAEAAVYLHGLAADFAVRQQDEHTLLATDVLTHLWQAFRFHPQDPAGYTWLEGLPGRGR